MGTQRPTIDDQLAPDRDERFANLVHQNVGKMKTTSAASGNLVTNPTTTRDIGDLMQGLYNRQDSAKLLSQQESISTAGLANIFHNADAALVAGTLAPSQAELLHEIAPPATDVTGLSSSSGGAQPSGGSGEDVYSGPVSAKLITRAEWGAEPSRGSMPDAPKLRSELYLHHTVTTGTGPDAMRIVQQVAFSRDFSDVSYTRVVDANGRIFEGRKTNKEGAHTIGHNRTAHAISAIGDYSINEPSEELLNGIARAAVMLKREGALTSAQLTGGHRDTKSTECPGGKLYNKIDDINRRIRALLED